MTGSWRVLLRVVSSKSGNTELTQPSGAVFKSWVLVETCLCAFIKRLTYQHLAKGG